MEKCSLARMSEKIKTFSEFGATGNGGITRYSLSEEALMARYEFVRRMKIIGAEITYDDIANVYATLPGTDENAKRIVMGSHADSVMNGGNYDGILGVLTAMEVLETVAINKIPHKHPLTAMIWTNEEGSLFGPCMMSSGIVCNEFLPSDIADCYKYDDMMKSASSLDPSFTFADAIEKSGYKGVKNNRISNNNSLCLFETHIEQGPILEDNGNDIGVVDCVLGMIHYRAKFYGQTTHAGTFPMKKRKDAFLAAANALIYLHEKLDALEIDDLVYTTGEVECHPKLHTCVPDYFDFSIDVRHKDKAVLDKALEIIKSLETMEWSGCKCEVSFGWKRDTVEFDKVLRSYVESAARESEEKWQYIHSGAGHDAQFAAYMLPTTMIFVQSKGGLSHCEEEYSTDEQCTMGATIMLNAVLKADKEFEDIIS